MTNIDIIIPVRNEEKNVAQMAERIFNAMSSSNDSYNMVFVIDPSTDNTLQVLENLSRQYSNLYIHHKMGKPGKAYSIIEAAKLSNAEYLAMLDGDLQYPPEKLPEMIEVAKKNGVSVAKRVTNQTSIVRKAITKANNFVFGKMLLGLNCDVQSGFKVFKSDIFDHIDISDIKPWAFDMPLLKTAVDLGYEIGEVEIDFAERTEGQSKVNFLSTSAEIASTAVKLRLKPEKVYEIKNGTDNPIGNGMNYKKKKFITHTSLPSEISAVITFTNSQKAFIGTIVAILLIGLLYNPYFTVLIFIGTLTFIYFIDMLFSAFVLIKSMHFPPELKFTDEELAAIDDRTLPKYSILVPMYKEGEVLPDLIHNLDQLDWPKNRLEVLILLEEDDDITQNAAKKVELPPYMKILVVPHSMPKTKPKACNYGLGFVTGEYVVVYDAEDKPDPLQLKKVYLGFQKSAENVVCLQSKLNYFNPDQNWLTRLFTAEYSLWFDIILPGLQSIESTIPLGGTSNHFKTAELKQIHGWDPFNVTEDCDLGTRLFKGGYKTAIVDSTTLEEANSDPKNWLRQRSRWIKGYLQTYLVHMRNPLDFFKSHGIHAFTFQLIIGMRITFMVINPFLWVTTIAYFTAYSIVGPAIEALFPAWIFYFAITTLTIGNFMYFYNYMIGCAKRGHYSLIKFVFLIPIYWIMNSISAFIAFYQLIVKPHYWEKTHHGLHLVQNQETSSVIEDIRESFTNVRTSGLASGGALVLASAGANVLNLIYNAFLGRALPVVEFGLISLIGNIFAISAVATSAIGQTVTYSSGYTFGKTGTVVKSFWKSIRMRSFIAGSIVLIMWVISIPFLADIFKSDSYLPFILFTPIWPIAFLVSVDQGFLRGNIKFDSLAYLIIVEAVVKLIAAYVMVGFGLSEYVYAAAPIGLIASFIVGWLIISNLKSAKAANLDLEKIDFPTYFFGASMVTKLAIVVFLSVDVILAKYLLSPTLAGQYALLSLAGKIVFFLGSLFGQFIDPVISKRLGEGKDTKFAFYLLLGLISFSAYSGFVFIGLMGNIFMPILFGNKVLPIVQYLPIYSLGMASFAIAISVIVYHQIRKNYILPILAFSAAIAEVVLITQFGNSIEAFSNIIGFLGITLLIAVMLAHFVATYAYVFIQNFIDMINIFSKEEAIETANEKKNILMFNWRDKKHVWAGGAEEYVHQLAKNWVRQGHSVTLFCGNDRKSKRNETLDGVNIVRRGGFFTVYIWAFVYYIFKFRNKFDLIIESSNGVPFFTPLYSRTKKALIVYHVHQEVFQKHLVFPLNHLAKFVESSVMPRMYSNIDIITISESSKNHIISKLGFSEDNISIIRPGVSADMFSTMKKAKNPRFSYVGRHKHYKNIDVAIKAFANVLGCYPRARFVIAGDGEETKSLKRLVRQMKLSKSIDFVGKVSEAKKRKIFGKSWAAIQPSSFEGWGITVIEANAAGTPVIAAKVAGLIDSVIGGKTGLLVKPESVEDLSNAMIDVISNESMRKDLSKNAYEWAQNFKWEENSKKMLEILLDRKSQEEIIFATA